MRFSITIPAYKAKYLNECIESVLVQTFLEFELIIVDDASPEDLKSIVERFDDSRIHYYRNEKNCGAINVVDNWNKCLQYAQGDYVICMGDDDKLLPNCLEEYSKLIEKYPGLGVYHGQAELIDENSVFKRVTARRPEWESVYSLIWHRWDNRNCQYIGDFLFDRNKLLAAGGFYYLPLAWGSDDITVAIMATEKGIANTQNVIFQYRDNGDSISSSSNNDLKIESIYKEKQWYNSLFLSKPTKIDDIKYWESAKQIMENRFLKRYSFHIIDDCRKNGLLRLIHWYRCRNLYGIPISILAYSFMMSFRRK